jgi:hypothetical protein
VGLSPAEWRDGLATILEAAARSPPKPRRKKKTPTSTQQLLPSAPTVPREGRARPLRARETPKRRKAPFTPTLEAILEDDDVVEGSDDLWETAY